MQAAVPAHLLLLFLIQRQLGIRLRLRGGHISLLTLLIGIAAGQAGRRGRQAGGAAAAAGNRQVG